MNNVEKNNRMKGKEILKSRYFAYSIILVLLVGIALTSEMKLTGFAASGCNLGLSVEPAIAVLPTTGSINITFLFTVAGDVTSDKKIMLVHGPPGDPYEKNYPWNLSDGYGKHWLSDGNFESIGEYVSTYTEGIYTFELQDGECRARTTLELIRLSPSLYTLKGTDADSIMEDFVQISNGISVLIADATVDCIAGINNSCNLIGNFTEAQSIADGHIQWLGNIRTGNITAGPGYVLGKSEDARRNIIDLIGGTGARPPWPGKRNNQTSSLIWKKDYIMVGSQVIGEVDNMGLPSG